MEFDAYAVAVRPDVVDVGMRADVPADGSRDQPGPLAGVVPGDGLVLQVRQLFGDAGPASARCTAQDEAERPLRVHQEARRVEGVGDGPGLVRGVQGECRTDQVFGVGEVPVHAAASLSDAVRSFCMARKVSALTAPTVRPMAQAVSSGDISPMNRISMH